jgi:hypothetical protein
MTRAALPVLLALGVLLSDPAEAAAAEEKVAVHADLGVAEVDGHKLQLDLFVPAGMKKPPLVVYIHGGSWLRGNRKQPPVQWLTEEGFALASISYRFSDRAIVPAQIHDVKAAIRWLRAHQDKYVYGASRIGVCGTSAGGHLAVLLGASGGVKELEGNVGENLQQSSRPGRHRLVRSGRLPPPIQDATEAQPTGFEQLPVAGWSPGGEDRTGPPGQRRQPCRR